MALLEIVAAEKRFGTTVAVADVSLAVERGEFFALLGPSGCGKTTLLRLVAGFESPDQGRILVDGTDVTDLPPYLRPVNMMFQSYALFPHMDVAANVAFGLRQQGIARHERARRAAEMLALVQMADYGRRRPDELSGGQRQRVALARALACMPKLLLLDEPLVALDRKLRAETRLELIRIQREVGITFLVVTHDQEEALSIASRIAVMKEGRVVQVGAPAEIYECPNSRFVADFVGEANVFEGVASAAELIVAGLGAPLPLPDGSAAEGPVSIAVRPEKLLLSTARPDGFAIAATVSALDYQGGISAVRLDAPDGRELRAQMASAAAARLPSGTAVWVSWAANDAVVLRQ